MIGESGIIVLMRVALAAILAAALVGCGSTDPRVTALRSKVAAQKELNSILATIHDKATMEAARSQLHRRADYFQELADQARELDPKISPELLDQMRLDIQELHLAVNATAQAIVRIQALPGGKDFIQDFDTLLPSK